MDYGFEHNGKVYTPNGTTGIAPEDNQARNGAIQAAELAAWHLRPGHQLAYYKFPAEDLLLFGRPKVYRESFSPCLHSYINQVSPNAPGTDNHAVVTTWQGVIIGRIVSAHVYRHNFGSRMVALTVKGTNGTTYHGRASWDNGSCINLRRSK